MGIHQQLIFLRRGIHTELSQPTDWNIDLKLHLGPELDQVHYEERQHYDAKNVHVLAGPLHCGRTLGDGVCLLAASLLVLNGQNRSVHDVENYEHCDDEGADQRIPVGAQELADGVVGGGPYDGDSVHQTVEGYEDDQECARQGHHKLTSYG